MKLNNVLSAQVQISPEDFSPVSLTEREQLEKLSEPTTYWKDAWRRLKQNKIALIYSNPFLRAAITSLLFNRIHPYTDGNGRTSRIIYNLKFTEQINKVYQTNLMLNPLNLSARILANKLTYVKYINQIAFNLKDDTNNAINKWLDFILVMADEQLYFSKDRLTHLIEYSQKNREQQQEEVLKRVKQMKISRLR